MDCGGLQSGIKSFIRYKRLFELIVLGILNRLKDQKIMKSRVMKRGIVVAGTGYRQAFTGGAFSIAQ